MKRIKIFSLDSLFATILVFLVITFLPIIFNLDFLDPIQNTLQDFNITDIVFSRVRDANDIQVDSNIVLVNIASLKRKDIARQLENINRFEPKVIGIDGFFRSEKGLEQDTPLVNAFSKIRNLVLVSQMKDYNSEKQSFNQLFFSNPMFMKYAKSGFANFVISEDQFRTVRTFSPKEIVKNKQVLSFPIAVASIYNKEKTQKILDRNIDNEIINFKRNIDKYRTIDYKEALDTNKDFSFVKNKIVLFGFIGPDIKTPSSSDIFFTPMNTQYVGKSYPDMYGVVVHANNISMILEEDYINEMPEWLSIIIVVLIVYFLMNLLTYLRVHIENWFEPISVISIIALLFSTFIAELLSFYFFNYILNLRASFFALSLSGMCYEAYNDSLKPLTIDFFNKIKNKFSKKIYETE